MHSDLIPRELKASSVTEEELDKLGGFANSLGDSALGAFLNELRLHLRDGRDLTVLTSAPASRDQ